MKVIGLVGPLASGKGIVADYLLKDYGFVSFSLSFMVHEERKKRGIASFTRATLQDIGDDLRKKEGEGVLAKHAVAYLQSQNESSVVIEGIRNPGEVAYLRTLPHFYLIAIDSDVKLRFERVIKRGKPWDPKDWETFIQVNERDLGDKNNKCGQQVRACMNLADTHIKNDSNLQNLYGQIEKIAQGNMIFSSARS